MQRISEIVAAEMAVPRALQAAREVVCAWEAYPRHVHYILPPELTKAIRTLARTLRELEKRASDTQAHPPSATRPLPPVQGGEGQPTGCKPASGQSVASRRVP